MTDSSSPPQLEPDTPLRTSGIAIASLILGILSVLLGLFVIGGLLGVIGIVLGAVDLSRKNRPRGVAGWGLGLSILGLVLAVLACVGLSKVIEAVQSGAGRSGLDTSEWTGTLAPDFTVTALDGRTITLSELRGKRVIVDFWATWCPPCVKEIPHFVQLSSEIPEDQLVIIGISNEDPDKLRAFVAKHAVPYAIASSEVRVSPYGDIRSIPTTFIIDRNGLIQNVLVGYHNLQHLRELAIAPDLPPKEASPALSVAPVTEASSTE